MEKVGGIEVGELPTVGRFVDAVVLARDIFRNNRFLLTQKIVTVNPDLTGIVRLMIDKEIKILKLGAETSKIGGLLTHSEEIKHKNTIFEKKVTPIILLSGANTYCWNRFSVCKELMFYYVGGDGEGAVSMGEGGAREAITSQKMANLLGSVSGNFWNIEIDQDLDIEHFTMVMATEVLLPWDKRDALHGMKDNGFTHYQMADRFKVPEVIIDRYFGTDYMRLSVESNKD